jgi:hypothetical protein
MRQIEPDMRMTAPLHLAIDGARDDVARRQLRERMHADHEPLTIERAQARALTAHGLRDQERPRLRMEQTGRVELHELETLDTRARAIRHREAVPGRDVGIGRVQVDLAATAGGEHRRRRGDRADASGAPVHDVGAPHRVTPRTAPTAEP